jgi:DNA-binding response OmpR family regulator
MNNIDDEISDKITGLDCGADDHVTKPFSTDELMARVRAMLRGKGEVIDELLTFADISLNVKTNELMNNMTESASMATVQLSLKEFQIMELLLQNPRQIITKERIISKIWGGDSDAEYNNVEVYISFLRKKLSFLKVRAEIRTSRGIGYSLAE